MIFSKLSQMSSVRR
jgi:hypothetical protein